MVSWFALGLSVIALGILVTEEVRRQREARVPAPVPQLSADQEQRVEEILHGTLRQFEATLWHQVNGIFEEKRQDAENEVRDLDTRASGALTMAVKQVNERIDGLELKPEPIELTDEQRLNLATAWAYVVCPHCGTVHQGLCPRVREIRYQPNGNPERFLFWPEGRWKPPRGSITAWDVYGAAGPPPPEEGEQKDE
jgi:hypothetical protein